MQTTYFPSVHKQADTSGQFSDEDLLFEILRTSPYQQRTKMYRHPVLDKAAAAKAKDLAVRDYFAHTSPDGVSANRNVRNAGYLLPPEYLDTKNNVESLSIGGGSPQDTADGWLNSPKHRSHVYGDAEMFRNQPCIGIGKAIAKDKRPIYVFISCPYYT